jgi:hypothetical protein
VEKQAKHFHTSNAARVVLQRAPEGRDRLAHRLRLFLRQGVVRVRDCYDCYAITQRRFQQASELARRNRVVFRLKIQDARCR